MRKDKIGVGVCACVLARHSLYERWWTGAENFSFNLFKEVQLYELVSKRG